MAVAVGVESNDLWRQIIAVVAVLGLLALTIFKLRGREATTSGNESARPFDQIVSQLFGHNARAREKAEESRRLASLDRLRLTPQHTLHLIRVGGQHDVLVATHPQGCSLLVGAPPPTSLVDSSPHADAPAQNLPKDSAPPERRNSYASIESLLRSTSYSSARQARL